MRASKLLQKKCLQQQQKILDFVNFSDKQAQENDQNPTPEEGL